MQERGGSVVRPIRPQRAQGQWLALEKPRQPFCLLSLSFLTCKVGMVIFPSLARVVPNTQWVLHRGYLWLHWGRQNSEPQDVPVLILGTHGHVLYLIWQRGMKAAHGMKVAN